MPITKEIPQRTKEFAELRKKWGKATEEEIMKEFMKPDAYKMDERKKVVLNECLHALQGKDRLSQKFHEKLTSGDGEKPIKHEDVYPERLRINESLKSQVYYIDEKIDKLAEVVGKLAEVQLSILEKSEPTKKEKK